MKLPKVDNIKDGNKAARREMRYGGKNEKNNRYGMKDGGRYKYGHGGEVMPKAKPC